MRASVAILAGGRATRMGGAQKALLVVEGEPIVARQLRAARAVSDDVFVVAGDATPFAPFGVDVVGDRVAGKGPLGGLDAALHRARQDSVVLLACDMPYVTAQSLELLLQPAMGADAVVPRLSGQAEPLFARYLASCGPVVERRLAEGALKMAVLLEELRVRWLEEPLLRRIDPEVRFLANWNAPRDLP